MPDFSLLKWTLLAVLLAALPCRSAEPRLAIVSTEDAREIAALATAQLGGKHTLLERDDLAKAGDERRLAELALADSRALGQIVGADGLLFLSREGGQYRARLTAVHLGFAVFDLEFQKEAGTQDVLAKIVSRLEEFAPKLTLTAQEAIPVSVLNLRADSTSEKSDEIERQATLLLESRLSAIPQVIVLERRHASALAFEKSLESNPPELLRGAAVVDGTLSFSQDRKDLTARLRLRQPGAGKPIDVAASGPVDDLPGLSASLAKKTAEALGLAGPPQTGAAEAEAREYLQEGIWAYRRELPQPALEALDSAELLAGETPDLLAVRIPVLCMLAVGTIRDIVPEPPMKDLAEATAQIGFLQRAISDLARYRAGENEAGLEFLETKSSMDGRMNELKRVLARSIAKMLAMLERTNNPETEKFRETARAYFGFDPLKGQMPADWNTCIDYAGDLANSKEEQIAYYRKLSTTYPWAAYGAWRLQLRVTPETFCSRFISDKETRRKEYDGYVNGLLTDPVAKPAALLYRAQWAAPAEKEAACIALYADILEQKEDLQKTNRLGYILNYALKLEEKRGVRTAHPDLIAALRYCLRHATKVSGPISSVWKPELFPEKDAPGLYQELGEFQKRVIAAGGSSNDLRWMRQKYINKFGDPEARPLPELAVTRYWYPKDFQGQLSTVSNGLVPMPGGVALLGTAAGDVRQIRYYEIKLPSFESTAVPVDFDGYPNEFVWSQDRILALCRTKGSPGAPVILDFDRASGQGRQYAVPKSTLHLDTAWGKYYLTLLSRGTQGSESGIARFDEKTGEVTVLADSRRKPAQNQFDDGREYQVNSIFPGPGRAAYALIGRDTYAIREDAGPWTPIIRIGAMNQACTLGDRTLISGASSYKNTSDAAVMIDPSKPEPTVWLGTPEVLPKRVPPKSATLPEAIAPPSWAGPPVWQAEESPTFHVQQYGFHGDDLFGLVDVGIEGKRAEILFYKRGRARPYRFTLRFDIPPDALAAVKSVISETANTFAMTITPHQFPFSIRMIPADEGICFRTPIYGFWFLPYSDIDAFLAKLPADETNPATAPAPPANQPKPDPKAEPGDAVDPANPDSFR